MKKQTGFTLIELMIVVAVIGVLSAVAIPQYQKYVAKAEIASILTTLTGMKTNVEAYTVENGSFPKTGIEDSLGRPSIMSAAAATSERGQILFIVDGTLSQGEGSIQYTFPKTVNAEIKDQTLKLKRISTGEWNCLSSIEKDLLPKSCTKS